MESTCDSVERADRLAREARMLLERVRLREIVAPYGTIVFTGSFFLNTMVYPDLDLYIPKITVPQLFDIGAQLASSELVFQVVFERSNEPVLPDGLYLKPRIRYGDWGRPWKFDIWSIDNGLMERQMETMIRFKQRMTEELRGMILRYKLSVMTVERRTPMGSGLYIYEAFIDEGLTEFDRVTDYLIANGIRMS